MSTKRFALLEIALAVILITPLKLGATAGMDNLTITVRNISTFDHMYDFKDGVSGRTWTQPIAAGESAKITLASNHSLDDGYGDLNWHQDGSGAWNHHGQLRNGESVTL